MKQDLSRVVSDQCPGFGDGLCMPWSGGNQPQQTAEGDSLGAHHFGNSCDSINTLKPAAVHTL